MPDYGRRVRAAHSLASFFLLYCLHMPQTFSVHTYPNGLRLITVPMQDTGTVTVQIMVGTGSRYETRDINGISHFLEHMMFKGTTKRPGAMDIAHELDSIGAEYNAFTHKEYTGYYAKASSDRFEKILDVVTDIFLNSKLAPEEVEKERGVIIQEINMYLDSPRHHVANLFEETMFAGNPLGWDIAGPREVIGNLPADQLPEYFHTHYFAENTIVGVAGKVDPEKVKELVWRYFSEMRHGERRNFIPYQIEQTEKRVKIFSKATDQTHLIVGVPGYGLNDERRHAANVLGIVLGAGMSSRLFTEVREKRGLAYHISGGASCYSDVGDFTVSAGLENAKLVEAIAVIMEQLKRLRSEPVSEAEVRKAKDFMRGHMLLGLETSDAFTSYYTDQLLYREEIITPEEAIANWEKVTVAEMQAVANDLLKTERLNLALVGPFQPDDQAVYNSLKL